jgi:hypothetical protein
MILGAAQVSASEETTTVSTEKIVEDDGYIIVTTGYVNSSASTRSTTHSKEAYKEYSYYNGSNVLCWAYTLNATFLYDGTLVVCTDASTSAAIYKSNWSFKNENHYKKSNTAYGSITFKNATNHKDVSLTISCTKNGTVS